MTQRRQTTTGEMISSVIFGGGGLVLLTGAFDPAREPLVRLVLALGAMGGVAAAGRFVIAAAVAAWKEGRR